MTSGLARNVMVSRLPPKMSVSQQSSGVKRLTSRDFTPTSWRDYFEQSQMVECGDDSFNVYTCGSRGPVLFLVHGGGFSGLSWALFASKITSLVECRCAAIDLRGHGETRVIDDENLSAEQLSTDVTNVINKMYGAQDNVVLIGHSLGGSIAVHSAASNNVDRARLVAVGVIDVVEGTALDSLVHMPSLLSGRPKSFPTLEKAIEWSVRSRHIRNVTSARVSMAGQLRKLSSIVDSSSPAVPLAADKSCGVLVEEVEDEVEEQDEGSLGGSDHTATPVTEQRQSATHPATDSYTWRVDLARTERHWTGWFTGLSALFLSCQQPKLLLLAGVDRLDRELTIGQMQGKFQMQVLPRSGHAVHEDCPDEVATAVATFLVRHKLVQPVASFDTVFPCC